MNEHEIVRAALRIGDPAARSVYIAGECAGDVELHQRVVQLLNKHGAKSSENATPLHDADDDEDETPDPADEPLDFLAPTSRPDSLGRIGHYEVLEILGRGAFGIVFRAFDDRLQRVVAVKVLAPELAATSPARKRFLREARSSAAVRHENVVQVHAVEEQPLPYLVMEYVPGETLQDRIDRKGPLEAAEIAHIGQQIAEGLAAAHAIGLIHRDIKPANVLIGNGPREYVKLTDFGLARAADDASMSQSGLITGTPMFMSPEQARGEHLDHRTDLFSLGSVLYAMACGRPPFRAANALAVLKRVNEDTPRPIAEINPEIPDSLGEVISRLHVKDPAERFQTAQEVANLLAGDLSKSKPARSTDGVPAIKLPASQLPTKTKTKVQHAQSTKRSRRSLIIAAALLVFACLGIAEATGTTRMRAAIARLWEKEETTQLQVAGPANIEPSQPQVDAERSAAEYFHARQVEMKLLVDGHEQIILAGAPLPSGPFTVYELKLNPQTKVDAIAQIASLRDFRRTYVPPVDSDLWARAIAKHPRMTMINAYGCDFTDAGLKEFAKLTDLEYLNLHGCTRITGAGLRQLSTCKSMKTLNLDSAMLQSGKYTLADLQDLRRALPNTAFTQDNAQPIGVSPPDRERQAAMWLQSKGPIRVDVILDGEEGIRNIEAGQPLPAGPFKLFGMILTGNEIEKLGDDLADQFAIHLKGVRLKQVYLPRSLSVLGLGRLFKLEEFAEVTYVSINKCALDDRMFAELAKLPNLDNLDCGLLPNITGKGIGNLKACPKLNNLTLLDLPLSPEAIEEMQQLPALAYLNIALVPCNEKHFAALVKLKITNLVASRTGLDDVMAAQLANLQSLDTLSLAGNPLTDKGLAEFKKLKNLKSLDIGMTMVTAKGVADLQKALPDCKIQHE